MHPSIQARLLLLSLGAVLGVAVVTLWLAYREAEHEVAELIDAQLTQYARIMLALAHAGDDDEVEAPHIAGHRYVSHVIFQIWQRDEHDDTLLLRSPEAPRTWPDGVARAGYSHLRLAGTTWRCFAAADDEKGRYVLAAIDTHIHAELTEDIAWGNVKPYLVGLPLLGLLLVWAVRGGLAPLRRLEADLAGRSPERLDPLPEAAQTKELRPLARTMNRLFDRLGQAWDNERRFTSDAAHELRTPLAAMKAQLQVAQRAEDVEEVRGAVRKALRGTDRMTHLVSQLLALARLESGPAAAEATLVALSELLAEGLGDAKERAQALGTTLESDIEPHLRVDGNAELLAVLTRNLLDNALRYTPAGGRVRVALARVSGRVLLSVRDTGPGVAEADRDKLGQRFQRLGAQNADGVGLGLSIVRRIADLHGAELVFGVGLDGRGLGVEVVFAEAR